MQVGPGLGLVVIRSPFQTKFQPAWLCTSVVLDYSCYVVLGLGLGGMNFFYVPALARVVICNFWAWQGALPSTYAKCFSGKTNVLVYGKKTKTNHVYDASEKKWFAESRVGYRLWNTKVECRHTSTIIYFYNFPAKMFISNCTFINDLRIYYMK